MFCFLVIFLFLENANLSDFLRKSNAGEQLVVDPSIKAEVKFVMMLIQHNCFFNITDHLSPLIRNEFKGSDAAQSFHCTRTKTAAIVNCLGDYFFDKIKEGMKQWPSLHQKPSFRIPEVWKYDISSSFLIERLYFLIFRKYDLYNFTGQRKDDISLLP